MTALVLENNFTHQYNALEVARQEHKAAKQHFREVCQSRIAGNVDHDRRFRDAMERLEAARERFIALLDS